MKNSFFLLGLAFVCSGESRMATPKYTSEGELVRPTSYETWMFLGASVGLSYNENANRSGPGLIHNVHTQPEAFEYYKQNGKWPEKTVMVLSLYEPQQKVAPNQQGYFAGKLVAVEVSVKDKEHFPDGWAYFDFSGKDGLAEKAKAKESTRCFSCHKSNGQSDNTFVQFYPVARTQNDRSK